MEQDPFYIKLLEKLGVNTTRLRWKLYQLDRKRQNVVQTGAIPSWLQWLKYPHKICRHCGAVNDREDRICHRCERRMPSMAGYRLSRMLGLMMPESAPLTMNLFLLAMAAVYAITVLLDGFALMGHSNRVLVLLGAFASGHAPLGSDWWRMLAFSLTHAGVIHIAFNAFALTQIGPLVETQIGPKRMLILVTATQFSAAAGTYFWYTILRGGQPFLTIGASGWLCGLLGFGIAFFGEGNQGGSMHRKTMVQWAVYVIVFGFIIGANNAAHIGGMAGGWLLGNIPDAPRPYARTMERGWEIAFWVSLALWALTLLLLGHSIITGWGSLHNP